MQVPPTPPHVAHLAFKKLTFYSQLVAYIITNSSTCKHLNIILYKSALYYNSFEFTPFAGFLPKAKPPINVVGDVAGKIAIIIVSFNQVTWTELLVPLIDEPEPFIIKSVFTNYDI